MAGLALVARPQPVEAHRSERDWMTMLRIGEAESWARVRAHGDQSREHLSGRATYILGDTINWLSDLPANSIHAIVTDPPYGIIEYDEKNQKKRRSGRGGVWRIPPSFDGANRQPLPRFTVLPSKEITELHSFFGAVAFGLLRPLVPGGHVFIASNPLLSTKTFHALQDAGFEKGARSFDSCRRFAAATSPRGPKRSFPTFQ